MKQKPFFYIPFLIPPKTDVFAERAIRFDELAEQASDVWGDYLRLLAQLCRAQQAAFNTWQHEAHLPPATASSVLPPSDGSVIPPLLFRYFTSILHAMNTPHHSVQAALQELTQYDEHAIATFAQQYLQNRLTQKHYAIWLHAALECAWTAWASQLQDDHIPPSEHRQYCPCCGGDAVASMVLNGGEWHGLRYLHCGMCNSRWHALRAKCTFCGDQSAISLQHIDNAHQKALHGARAEQCDACGHYRKLFFLEKQPYADPIADDLASIALDILLSQEAITRGGHNPFLLTESSSFRQPE